MIGINCIRTLSELRDSTFLYELCFDREYTVQELLDFVMNDKNEVEWVSVSINDENGEEIIHIGYNKRVCKLIKLPQIYTDAVIAKARFSEEYGSLNFHLTIKTP